MKSATFVFIAAAGLLAASLGCQQLDLAKEGDPQRTLSGTVNLRGEVLFPPDTEVVVRVVETATTERPRGLAATDVPLGDRGGIDKKERVLGEQIIKAPGVQPVAFQVDYRADDTMLRHGLNVDVRISSGGKVRYRSLDAHVVTLGSAPFPHTVWVEAVR